MMDDNFDKLKSEVTLRPCVILLLLLLVSNMDYFWESLSRKFLARVDYFYLIIKTNLFDKCIT